MDVRFYIDTETSQLHILNHGVSEEEVLETLFGSCEDRPGVDGARLAIGQTQAGRYIRVLYVPDADARGIFVITAYELRGKQLSAFKRRRKKKMASQRFPKGWDENRVREVIAHYEAMSDDQLAEEDDRAYEIDGVTLLAVPCELEQAVKEFIAQNRKRS